MKFYKCNVCKKIITILNNEPVSASTICCNKEMEELKPLVKELNFEKHIPSIKIEGNKVGIQIGSELHPSNKEHYIEFIAIEFDNGETLIKRFDYNEEPIMCLTLGCDKKIKAVYAYCNIHGLWVNKCC